MSLLLVIGIVESFFIFIISAMVLKSDFKKSANRVFFVFANALALWSLFVNISANVPMVSFSRLVDVFGMLAGLSLVFFAYKYPASDSMGYIKRLAYFFAIAVTVFIPIVLFTPLVVSDISYINNTVLPIDGSVTWMYFMLIYLQVLTGSLTIAYKFFWIYRNNIPKRRQMMSIVVGVAFGAILILSSFVPFLFDKKNTALIDNTVPFSVVIFITFIAYGIIKRGLFDVRLAIVRSVTYSLLIATLAGIYAGSTFALSSVFSFGQSTPAQIVANIVISLILVFLFQPLRRFFDKITNRIFYKDNYNSDEFFGRLNKTLAVTTDLRELLKRASKEIGTTLKSSQAFFYIYTSDSEHHIAAGTSNHTDLTIGVAEDIKQYAINKPGVIVATILDDDNEIKQVLTTHKIEIVLPLIQDKAIIGFLCLGENMGSNYTDRDVSVLNTVSNGLIIAIQNALAVQEIRDFNVTLRQRIAEATQELRVKNAMLKKLDKAKDEFVSMASHQLRTPLTSVKGYLSMVVEGDAGKVTPQQKELLNEAYSSNERMVNLVNDFLNVSRIQTGKFMLEKIPVDLSKLVDEEVKGLVQNASKRQITLDYKAPLDVPQLNIDEGKIRQVVMNYIDNAIYYSNTDSTIKIDLSVDGDDVVFTVKDTGIGVPVSEQSGLFTKFYRASNAKKQRPDGTGVGLYLAKKIITAHDGKIVFSTVEGRGSTFGFRLPIKELALSPAKQLNDLKD